MRLPRVCPRCEQTQHRAGKQQLYTALPEETRSVCISQVTPGQGDPSGILSPIPTGFGRWDTLQIPWEKAFVKTLVGVSTTSKTLPGKAISAETWLSVPSSSQNNTKRFVIVSEHICFALHKKKKKRRTLSFT